MLDLKSSRSHIRYERVERAGLFRQRTVDVVSELVALGERLLVAEPFSVVFVRFTGVFDDGNAVLQAETVADLAQSEAAAKEVAEFSRAVHGG